MKQQVKPWGAYKLWEVTCVAGLPHRVLGRSSLEAGAQFILEWPGATMASIEVVS